MTFCGKDYRYTITGAKIISLTGRELKVVKCEFCNKKFTKSGIQQHQFYNHIEKLDELHKQHKETH